MERQGVDMSHGEDQDQELQPLGDSKEHLEDEETHDEEAGGGPASANRQMMLEGKSASYFSSLESTIEILKNRPQELIQNINESRQKDHSLMTNFRDSLKIKVSDLTEKLEERMYQIYNHHNKIIQEKLQEFTQKMAKISHLETELKQVCHTVETVYKDLCLHPEDKVSLPPILPRYIPGDEAMPSPGLFITEEPYSLHMGLTAPGDTAAQVITM
ncbi:PREDICTED: synaptonemal complex central element protein 2 [Chrysochloris asiatica]|uniref:Synaptonemal complex central element protein 2 n=1 Tax=Chrysochloris asiatica TaxID=185453 RepID=A0A9B0WZG8_CHRAS|nr:PREDICTED: synaptonemal complex central element protein 2 [Chrysochloris asiatica]